MLNRRHLRIKVLQALYAYYRSEGGSVVAAEKSLMTSVNKIWYLYISFLAFFDPLLRETERRIEERKMKRMATESDLSPDLNFVNDPTLNALAKSAKLEKEIELHGVDMAGLHELSRKIYDELEKSERYEAFMAKEQVSPEESRAFISSIFKKFVANSDLMLSYFEDMSIHWADDIDLVCNAVVKTIKKVDPAKGDIELLPFFKDAKEDKKFVSDLFKKSIAQNDENEASIDRHASRWEVERIAMMDMLLMKMAVTEVQTFSSIPVKVTLNEYIEISKFYSTPRSDKFINGVLDKLFIELKEEGKIKKMGRGLIEN